MSMGEYEFRSPFITLTVKADLRRRTFVVLLGLWLGFWLAVGVGLLYAYAVLFAEWVGFETAVLVGIGIVVFGVSSDA